MIIVIIYGTTFATSVRLTFFFEWINQFFGHNEVLLAWKLFLCKVAFHIFDYWFLNFNSLCDILFSSLFFGIGYGPVNLQVPMCI